MHRIIDARWTRTGNVLVVACGDRGRFETRADRWRVACPYCRQVGSLDLLRSRYLAEHSDPMTPRHPTREVEP